MVFKSLKKVFTGSSGSDSDTDYLELDLGEKSEKQNKIDVRLFILKQYEDVTEILNFLREGYTIAIIDIRILKQKDPIELKRAISKIKKTTDALEGGIAGHENIIIVTPPFAKISKEEPKQKEEPKNKFDDY